MAAIIFTKADFFRMFSNKQTREKSARSFSRFCFRQMSCIKVYFETLFVCVLGLDSRCQMSLFHVGSDVT